MLLTNWPLRDSTRQLYNFELYKYELQMGTTRTREKGCIFSCMRLLTIKLRKEEEQIQIESNKRRDRERDIINYYLN